MEQTPAQKLGRVGWGWIKGIEGHTKFTFLIIIDKSRLTTLYFYYKKCSNLKYLKVVFALSFCNNFGLIVKIVSKTMLIFIKFCRFLQIISVSFIFLCFTSPNTRKYFWKHLFSKEREGRGEHASFTNVHTSCSVSGYHIHRHRAVTTLALCLSLVLLLHWLMRLS